MNSGKIIFASVISMLFTIGLCVLVWVVNPLSGEILVKIIFTVILACLFVAEIFIMGEAKSGSVKENSKYKWHDRKRTFLGLPLSFTRYYLTGEKLTRVKGFFNIIEDEVKLYRVTDFALTRKFWQRIFGLGTLKVLSSDKSCPTLELLNIKRSSAVKELMSKLVEDERDRKRVTGREIINNHDHDCDGMDDYDGDNDDFSGEIM